MTVIAPVLFDAFPEGASQNDTEPHLQCFNAGAPAEAIRILSTPCAVPRVVGVAAAAAVLGLLPAIGSAIVGLFTLVLCRDLSVFNMPDWLLATILSGLGLAVVSAVWSGYLFSSRHPNAKAWKAALDEAWLTHGGQIFDLNRVPYAARNEVLGLAQRLEAIRKGLNRLDPEGDELDGARYALQRYIEVCDIPLLGKRAADAPHIKDPAVRQAAKEYKQALKQQEYAKQAVEVEISLALGVNDARLQARTDAEIIRLVHER